MTTNKEMLAELELAKKKMAQDKMQLMNTKTCVQMLRDARSKNFDPEVCNEIFQLIRASAVDEWGAGTFVDDYIDPGYFLIINGKKQQRL